MVFAPPTFCFFFGTPWYPQNFSWSKIPENQQLSHSNCDFVPCGTKIPFPPRTNRAVPVIQNIYHLVMTNSSPWKIHPFLSSVNYLFLWAIYTMAMLVITRGYWFLALIPKSPCSLIPISCRLATSTPAFGSGILIKLYVLRPSPPFHHQQGETQGKPLVVLG